MKTSIYINGQPMGNSTLKIAIQTNDCEVKKHFQNYELLFNTKKEAVKALSDGYQYLKSDTEDWENSCASYQRGTVLNYDASYAKIIKTN